MATDDKTKKNTQEKTPLDALQEEIVAQGVMGTRSAVLDSLQDQIKTNDLEIESLLDERSQLAENPELVEVPADFQVSKLTRIGAALSNIDGKSNVLDALLQEKQNIAAAQRQAKLHNINIQNAWNLQRRQEIRTDLQAAYAEQVDLQSRMAESVDTANKSIDEIRLEQFDFALNELVAGRTSPEAVAADHAWAMARRGIDKGALIGLHNTKKTNEMSFHDYVGNAVDLETMMTNPQTVRLLKTKLAQEMSGDSKITSTQAEEMIDDYTLRAAIMNAMRLSSRGGGTDPNARWTREDVTELNLWQAAAAEGTQDIVSFSSRVPLVGWPDPEYPRELRQKIETGTATSEEVQQWIDVITSNPDIHKKAIKERKWRIAIPKSRRVNYLQAMRNYRDMLQKQELWLQTLEGGVPTTTPTGAGQAPPVDNEADATGGGYYDFDRIIDETLGGSLGG